MASVKISELNTLNSISNDDFLPIVDSGSGTTYRVTFNTLNVWLEAYGTVSHSLSSDWANFARSASYAATSSWALRAISSSYALTASYYDIGGYSPINATSASFSATASSLQGNGTSWEKHLKISSSLTLNTGSVISIPKKSSRIPPTEPGFANTIYFNTDFGVSTNDYAKLYYMESPADSGRLYFDLGDNIDSVYGTGVLGSGSGEAPAIESISLTAGGFLFSAFNSDTYYATASLLFIRSNGKVYGRGFEARDFSQSLQNQVGFYGTSSYALTASYLIGGSSGGGVPIGTIMDYAGTGAPADTNWALCDGSEVDGATYTTLAALLGTGGSSIWGAASVGYVRLPDLNGRMTIGSNGGYSRISGSVGNTGGGEKINSHFHMIGKSSKGIFYDYPNGRTKNDDLYLWWMTPQSVNTAAGSSQVPRTLSPYGDYGRFFWMRGDDGDDMFNPVSTTQAASTDTGWCIGTTYGLTTDTTGDLMPPYAVTRKIIRIL